MLNWWRLIRRITWLFIKLHNTMFYLHRWIYIVKRGDRMKIDWGLEDIDAWFLLRTTSAGFNFINPPLDIIAKQYPEGTIEIGKDIVPYQSETLTFPMTFKYGYPFRFHFYVDIRYQKVFIEDSNGQFGTKLVGLDRKNNLALYKICTGGCGPT